MRNKKDLKKTALYVVFFIPLILVVIEVSLSSINRLRGFDLPRSFNYKIKYDPITGWRGFSKGHKQNKKNPNLFLLNKHSLLETPYVSDKSSGQKIHGILITGNSLAAGFFPGVGEKNKNTFYSKFESKLRQTYPSIDVVNTSFSGFNSWQEHVEIARYMNSSPLHNDLPDINLVLSLAGVQDFWTFMGLITDTGNESRKNYKKANGTMISLWTISFTDIFTKAYEGSPFHGFKVFYTSLFTYIQEKTHTHYYIKKLVGADRGLIEITKGEIKNIFSNEKKSEEISNNSFEKNEFIELNLQEIVNKKLLISFEEYLKIRDYSINSVIRNIRATNALINDIPYVYMYSPTRFNSEISKREELSQNVRYKNNLTMSDFQKLERDFREELLLRISSIKGIKVIDYAGIANYETWFLDNTHLNAYGQKKLAELIYDDTIEIIKKFTF